MGELTITTTLQARGPAAAIVLDDEQVAALGDGAKRFPVAVTVNGFTWRTSVARMRGEFLVGLSKAVRAGCGAEAGDAVTAQIALDTAPREVELPAALAEALAAEPELGERFAALPYSARKEHARGVTEAKQETTRERRVQKIVAGLRG